LAFTCRCKISSSIASGRSRASPRSLRPRFGPAQAQPSRMTTADRQPRLTAVDFFKRASRGRGSRRSRPSRGDSHHPGVVAPRPPRRRRCCARALGCCLPCWPPGTTPSHPSSYRTVGSASTPPAGSPRFRPSVLQQGHVAHRVARQRRGVGIPEGSAGRTARVLRGVGAVELELRPARLGCLQDPRGCTRASTGTLGSGRGG